MLDGFNWISGNAHWRIETPSGGFPELDGEARIAGNSLGVILDAYEMNLYRERSVPVIKEIIETQSTREFLADHGAVKAKPWMCSIFVVQMLRARDLAIEYGDSDIVALVNEKYPLWADFLASHCIGVDSRGYTSMWHRVNPNSDLGVNMWDLVGADALVEWDPVLAEALYRSGSDKPWYGGHPTGVYGTLLAHSVMNVYGGKTMKALEE
jgi:hypothetical protein